MNQYESRRFKTPEHSRDSSGSPRNGPVRTVPALGNNFPTVAEAYGICLYCSGKISPGDKLLGGEHHWHVDKWRPLAAITGASRGKAT